MKKSAIALRVLPGLLLGVCATAAVAGPQDANVLSRTPFVLGEDSSMAAPAELPQTEDEAVAAQHEVADGIVAMELPEDRLLELVAVRRADGTLEISHQPVGAPMPVATQEVTE